jgi:hypothetical protein
MLAFDILAGEILYKCRPGKITPGNEQKRERNEKNSGRRSSHPRGTVSPLLRSRTTSLPHRAMVATLSEAAASAYNNRPGPPPRRPLTSSTKSRCTKAKTPTKHQGLQGGVSKKIATWTPPPPTPTGVKVFTRRNLGLWDVGGAGFPNNAFKKE